MIFVGLVVFSLALIFVFLVFLFWTIIHVLVSRLSLVQKFFWVVSMLLFPLIGSVLYVIFVNKKKVILKDG